MAKALLEKTILVTRPSEQNKYLCQKLQDEGADVITFPTIEIHALENKSNIVDLESFDYVIFTSANAVKYGIPQLLSENKTWPSIVNNIAIGKSTKNAMVSHGLHCHLMPQQDFSSAGILNLAAFKSINEKKILIATGLNGNTRLKERLNDRGAIVTEYFCYERRVPNYSSSVIIERLNKKIDFIICTSNTCLEHLALLLDESLMQKIRIAQIIAFSQRIKALTDKYEFNNKPIITSAATDDAIVAAIITKGKP